MTAFREFIASFQSDRVNKSIPASGTAPAATPGRHLAQATGFAPTPSVIGFPTIAAPAQIHVPRKRDVPPDPAEEVRKALEKARNEQEKRMKEAARDAKRNTERLARERQREADRMRKASEKAAEERKRQFDLKRVAGGLR